MGGKKEDTEVWLYHPRDHHWEKKPFSFFIAPRDKQRGGGRKGKEKKTEVGGEDGTEKKKKRGTALECFISRSSGGTEYLSVKDEEERRGEKEKEEQCRGEKKPSAPFFKEGGLEAKSRDVGGCLLMCERKKGKFGKRFLLVARGPQLFYLRKEEEEKGKKRVGGKRKKRGLERSVDLLLLFWEGKEKGRDGSKTVEYPPAQRKGKKRQKKKTKTSGPRNPISKGCHTR